MLSVYRRDCAHLVAFFATFVAFLVDGCSATQYKNTASGSEGGSGGDSAGAAGDSASGGTAPKGGSSGRGGATTTKGGNTAAGGATSGQGGSTAAATGGSNVGGTSTMGGTTAAPALCGFAPNPGDDRTKRRLLVRDEAASKLALIDVGNAENSWDIVLDREDGPDDGVSPEPQGRDLQLVGNCRVLVPTYLGYDEYDLVTHQRVAEVTAFAGTLSAQRLRNKNTLIVGVGTEATPWQGKVGIVLLQVDATGTVVGTPLVYPGTFAQLVRQTESGTFLVSNNQRVFEGTTTPNDPIDGYQQVLSTVFTVAATPPPRHVWMGLRVKTGGGANETVVSTGYDASLCFFNADGSIRKTITGGTGQVTGGATAVNPNFFAGLQVLPNGNYLVTNWSGSTNGHFTDGIPILEYNPVGALVWYWGDPAYANRLSGLQAAIVLDGLNPTKLNVEGSDGKLVAVD